MNEPEFGSDGIMKWERVTPPLFWPDADASIVADRHLPDGTRQHMICGNTPAIRMVANAEIIGSDDAPDAEFSSQSSHLSGWGRSKPKRPAARACGQKR